MAKIVVVSAEGVLCRTAHESVSIRQATPVAEGMDLVAALASSYNIAVASQETDSDLVVDWLKEHGMAAHFSYVVPRRVGMPTEHSERMIAQAKHMRACGFTVGMVVDANPATIALGLTQGYTGMVFSHPEYMRPEWRPDDNKGVRSWAAIEAEMAEQARLKAEDTRLRPDQERYETV